MTNPIYAFNGDFVRVSVHETAGLYSSTYRHVLAYIVNSGFSTPQKPSVITTPVLEELVIAVEKMAELKDVNLGLVHWDGGRTTGFGFDIDEFHKRLKNRGNFEEWWPQHLDRGVKIASIAAQIPYPTISTLYGRLKARDSGRTMAVVSEYDPITSDEAIRGYRLKFVAGVYGGSVELSRAFTKVMVWNDAMICLPESGLGAVPGLGGGATILKNTKSRHNTQMLIGTGGTINAEMALRIGLADIKAPDNFHLHNIIEPDYFTLMTLSQLAESDAQGQRGAYEMTDADIDISNRQNPPKQAVLESMPHSMNRIESALRRGGQKGLEGALRENMYWCLKLGLGRDFEEAVNEFVRKREEARANREALF